MAQSGWIVVLFFAGGLAVHAQERVCDRATSDRLEAEGLAAMRGRDYQVAERRFTEAFDACPENPAVLLQLAQSQTPGRNFDGAIRTSTQYLALNPASTAGRLILANAYLMALRLKEALAEADLIVRAHPAHS